MFLPLNFTHFLQKKLHELYVATRHCRHIFDPNIDFLLSKSANSDVSYSFVMTVSEKRCPCISNGQTWSIAGITMSDYVYLCVFKRRIWFDKLTLTHLDGFLYECIIQHEKKKLQIWIDSQTEILQRWIRWRPHPTPRRNTDHNELNLFPRGKVSFRKMKPCLCELQPLMMWNDSLGVCKMQVRWETSKWKEDRCRLNGNG